MDHCSGSCGTAPFGTVDVTQDGTNTVKLVVSLSAGDKFVSTGFPGSFGFNISGNPTIGISNLTAGWSLLSTTAGNLHFDGFGNLDYALSCDSCGNGGSNPFAGPISFDITAAGLNPASFAELSRLPPGSEQTFFVADIIGTNGKTGPVGATLTQTAVPEPGTVSLLAAGALSLLFVGLRRNRNAATEQA
ncbi:MAG TPA: PEP-CTERM sorting domain-containing protein [Bryobacteraceae bacterium]